MIAKGIIRALLPVNLRLALRRWFGDVTRYTGPYASWDEAMAAATGYSDDAILQQVRRATREVVAGKAAYEQDSVQFHAPSPPARILRVLALASADAHGPVAVLDFGGSLGSLYFRARPFLAQGMVSAWTVCEQPNFVGAGREFEDGVLRFVADPGQAPTAHVLVLSSVLPYLEDPVGMLERLARGRPRWILIDRTPLSPDGQWHLFDQHVPRSIYRATYPVWLIPRDAIAEALTGYVLAEEAELPEESLRCGGVHASYRWMIWRNRECA